MLYSLAQALWSEGDENMTADNFDAYKGGQWMKTTRMARGHRIEDVIKLEREALGEGNEISSGALSMLERGRVVNPSLPVLARYAYVLGVPIAKVVEAYGLPQVGGTGSPSLHESIQKVIDIADHLPPLARERLYAQLEYAATQALDAAQGRTKYLPLQADVEDESRPA